MPSRVLIIDDDLMVAQLLREHLTNEGYTVADVSLAEEGFAFALKSPPDLILLDVNLPDATGFQMCARFKENPVTRSIPIIMMTGQARFPNQQAIGKEFGASAYILKPFNILEVGQRVKDLINGGGNHEAPNMDRPMDAPTPAPPAPVADLPAEPAAAADTQPPRDSMPVEEPAAGNHAFDELLFANAKAPVAETAMTSFQPVSFWEKWNEHSRQDDTLMQPLEPAAQASAPALVEPPPVEEPLQRPIVIPVTAFEPEIAPTTELVNEPATEPVPLPPVWKTPLVVPMSTPVPPLEPAAKTMPVEAAPETPAPVESPTEAPPPAPVVETALISEPAAAPRQAMPKPEFIDRPIPSESVPEALPVLPVRDTAPFMRWQIACGIFVLHLIVSIAMTAIGPDGGANLIRVATMVAGGWALLLGLLSAIAAVLGVTLLPRQGVAILGIAAIPIVLRAGAALLAQTSPALAFLRFATDNLPASVEWSRPLDIFEMLAALVLGFSLRRLPGGTTRKSVLATVFIAIAWVLTGFGYFRPL